MTSLLTTITPVWRRSEMLRGWLKSIKGASIPEVRHFVYFVGEYPPDWWLPEVGEYPVTTLYRSEKPGLSIGHYHNLGARNASGEWIMKMDVDTIPHMNFFNSLLPVIATAKPREWFNVGMLYINQVATDVFLRDSYLPISESIYDVICKARQRVCAGYILPQATNFVCRKEDYLSFGGCSGEFKGWGWEDYQQIYDLEWHQQGQDPLPGVVDSIYVTRRCRDEISRPKALELWYRNKNLCLLHRHHASDKNSFYRAQSKQNKDVLLRHILNRKGELNETRAVKNLG